MLIRHEPLNLLNELVNALEEKMPRLISRDDSRVETGHWIPPVDIKEEPERFLLYMDVPGINPKDIEISMENNMLTLKGARYAMENEEKKDYFRIERVKGKIHRRFTLPDTADNEHIQATVKQGVLEISINKKKTEQTRKITVQVQE